MSMAEDELLMAYADGELDAVRAAEVERRLAQDAVARETVRRYRESAALVRAAFAGTVDEPVPAKLETAVRRAGQAGKVVAFRQRRPAPAWRRLGLPLAASVALAIGLGGGWWLAHDVDELAVALETAPSGESVRLADGAVAPISTFRDGSGRWCREFDRSGAAAATGVACRAADGSWHVELLVAADTAAETDYAPAGEEASGLEPLLRRLSPEPPLDPGDEARLIKDGWR